MYCLQWLIPVLLIPKHWLHPTFLIDQAIFMCFYVVGFFMERRFVAFSSLSYSLVKNVWTSAVWQKAPRRCCGPAYNFCSATLRFSCLYFLINKRFCQWKKRFRPCYICSLIFFTAVGLLCWSDSDSCIFWPSCKTVFNGEMCSYVFEDKRWIS